MCVCLLLPEGKEERQKKKRGLIGFARGTFPERVDLSAHVLPSPPRLQSEWEMEWYRTVSLPQTSVPIRIFRPQFTDSRAFCFSRHPFRSLPPLYPVMKEQPFSAANLLCSQSARPTRYEVPSTHQSGGSGCVETKQIIG